MKKIIFTIIIFSLIIFTTLIKNSSKEIDKEIFKLEEEISILKNEREMLKLEHDYLTSPKKLKEYQQFYFEDKFVQKKIENLRKIEFFKDTLKIEKMVKIDE